MSDEWNPATLYTQKRPSSPRPYRPPPSAFYPFQSHPGNPDPLPTSRRNSWDSILAAGSGIGKSRSPTDEDSSLTLERPIAPFMREHRDSTGSSGSTPFTDSSREGSPAPPSPGLTHSASSPALKREFRAPFLSPASRNSSRPGSAVWSPPPHLFNTPNLTTDDSTPTTPYFNPTPHISQPNLPTPPTSNLLNAPIPKSQKPWMLSPKQAKSLSPPPHSPLTPSKSHRIRTHLSSLLTTLAILTGAIIGAYLTFRGYTSVDLIDESRLCSVLNENWSNGVNEAYWNYDVGLGGWGNEEFQVYTDPREEDDPSKAIYVNNNELWIIPKLMSNVIGSDNIFKNYTYKVNGCTLGSVTTTQGNKTVTTPSAGCAATSNEGNKIAIPPIISGRLNTKGKVTIDGGKGGGKVEIRAKLPRGDWLWPAVWMLPEDEAYGAWPRSGEIDIMEARGNTPTYPAQGSNFVRSSLNYGPLESVVKNLYGWWQVKRGGYADDFHTYTLEWTPRFMRVFVDSRLQAMLDIKTKSGKEGFWFRGGFPRTAVNGSTEVVVRNPWEGRGVNAPYDQKFYLIINLAAGGTSGWFPDDVGSKPWRDEGENPMYDFAKAQGEWERTWASDEGERGFRVKSVKMWQAC